MVTRRHRKLSRLCRARQPLRPGLKPGLFLAQGTFWSPGCFSPRDSLAGGRKPPGQQCGAIRTGTRAGKAEAMFAPGFPSWANSLPDQSQLEMGGAAEVPLVVWVALISFTLPCNERSHWGFLVMCCRNYLTHYSTSLLSAIRKLMAKWVSVWKLMICASIHTPTFSLFLTFSCDVSCPWPWFFYL